VAESPAKTRERHQDEQAAVIRKLLADAGYDVRVNTQNRVRYTDAEGNEFYFEIEEMTD
jgi:hypothetical protein